MVTFDEVLPTLVRCCEEWPPFQHASRCVAVRDISGRVRLVVEVKPGQRIDEGGLTTELRKLLGQWFPDDVYTREGSAAARRVVAAVLDQAAKEDWQPTYPSATGAPTQLAPGRWFKIERRLSKLGWFERSSPGGIWPLTARAPVVVTFFSFKGGVGRSTLLAAMALQLARMKKRVLAVDLDLEAPGLGLLLGASEGRGVLDFIVDSIGVGQHHLDTMVSQASAAGAEAAYIDVLPAGSLDASYFEKLARLDFVGGLADESTRPVPKALTELLKAAKRRAPAPDFILLDARAGLHDLAGLSLHGLAHIDVLVARDSEQSFRGLNLVVRALGQARKGSDFRALVVHSMAPADRNSDEARRVESEFLDRSFSAFEEHVYHVYDDAPAVEDATAAHFPWVVRSNELLQRFVALDSVRETLLGSDYERIARRLLELAAPEAP